MTDAALVGPEHSPGAVAALTVAPQVPTMSSAATAVMSFRMGAECNGQARETPVEPLPHGHQGGTGQNGSAGSGR